jgi:hypothetical protein
MILGRGVIASIIEDREGFIFFACGESNRFELTDERRKIEADRILSCDRSKMFVYFSGLNIYYPEAERRGAYTEHKIEMERLVKENFNDYCIFRIGSVLFGDNPNTIYNHIRNKILGTGSCEVKPVYRYFNTKDEIVHWLGRIPSKGKHEMNVTGKLTWMPDFVEQLKKELNESR